MANFDFVVGDDFRAALQSDYEELEKATASGAWKSVHVLAGSIVEAMLVDYIAGSDLPKSKNVDPLTLDLGAAIKLCREEGIVTERVASLSDVVRSYRNLIHPGRIIRLGESVDEQSASLAATLVEMVAKEVGRSRAEKKGLTAEQLVGKLAGDPSALSILTHLIVELDKGEAERLLLKVIPESYFEILSDPPSDAAFLKRLGVAYRQVFMGAPTAVKKKVALRYTTVLREEMQSTVQTWETVFFQPGMLRELTSADQGMVKTHLLARVQSDPSVQVFRAAHGIGHYLDAKEQGLVIDEVVKEIVYGTDTRRDTAARDLLEDLYRTEPSESDKALVARLASWVTFLRGKERDGDADTIDALRSKYEDIADLPF